MGIDGMSWTYTETYSANNSILFKSFIDSELGNNDSFVAAWELLKIDKSSRRQLMDALDGNMDVKINGSSDHIIPLGVESDISMESLGPVSNYDRIVNFYEIHYIFEDSLSSMGSSIWFLGEPETHVTIRLPENIEIISTEGIDNSSIGSDISGTQISGKFSSTGEAVVYFEMNDTLPEETVEVEMAPFNPSESDEQSFRSLVEEIFPGLTDEFLETLEGSSLI